MARPKLGEGDTERLHVKISTEELTAIDDWRFTNRVPSRSEAVRRLCQIALHSEIMAQQGASDALWLMENMEAEFDKKRLLTFNTGKWMEKNVGRFLRVLASILEIEEVMKVMRAGNSVEDAIAKAAEYRGRFGAAIAPKEDK